MKAYKGEVWLSGSPYEFSDVLVLGNTDDRGNNAVKFLSSGRINASFRLIGGRVKFVLKNDTLENE